MRSGRWPLPLLILSAASGLSALIYEIVWFQLLELAIGSTAISLGILLAAFMGGTCLGSILFPRVVAARRNPLRIYALIEIGIALLGLAVLLLMPFAVRFYAAWGGYGPAGFLLRGMLAAACLLPPTLLMGATLPALSRAVVGTPGDRISWLGLLYGGNIAGAVLGSLVSGFYLLREYDVGTATYAAAALNVAVAAAALALRSPAPPPVDEIQPPVQTEAAADRFPAGAIYALVALSGLCALAAETVWARTLGLLFGASVYTFSIILAVFLLGLGIGSSIGSLLCRTLKRTHGALAVCQVFAGVAIAWSAHTINGSLPYWPIDPSLSSSIWFNYQLDLVRTLWALLPPTIFWGATFPLALAALQSQRRDSARLMAAVYTANTLGAIAGALGAGILAIAWFGSQRLQQSLVSLSMLAALMVLVPQILASWNRRARWPASPSLGVPFY